MFPIGGNKYEDCSNKRYLRYGKHGKDLRCHQKIAVSKSDRELYSVFAGEKYLFVGDQLFQ